METKVCTKCKQELPATPEYFNGSKKGCKLGLRGTCKICQRREGKEYYEKTKPPLKRDEIFEETKICIKCGIEYLRTDEYFPKHKDNRDGLRNECKLCNRQKSNKYREDNREKCLEICRKYHGENKEQLLVKAKERYRKNREVIIEKVHEYRENNKDKVRNTRKKHYQNHKEEVKRKRTEYYYKNKDHVLEKDKIYKQKHKIRYREIQRESKRRRYATDLMFNLNEKISSGIRISLRNDKQGRHWEELVSFTLQDLRQHIESLFQEGMTWEKFFKGEIHIDHKRPKASFNFSLPDDAEFQECWALSNLQPLWKEENLKKRDKWKESLK